MGGTSSSRRGRAAVAATALLAGLLFATSAATAQGTDLRAGRRTQLTELITAQQRALDAQERDAAVLRRRVADEAARAAAGSSRAGAARAEADALAARAGLTALQGPGLVVALDDAPRPRAGQPPASTNPDDLVVHQQDVQSVVNALWAGGAEAMTLMGQRVVSTSAVRCVGNTLLLQGRVYSPPFVVAAIGDAAAMRRALEVEPGVQLLRRYVDAYGVGLSVTGSDRLRAPAYDGDLELPHVQAP